jgi:hypothetical protein
MGLANWWRWVLLGVRALVLIDTFDPLTSDPSGRRGSGQQHVPPLRGSDIG